jgi:hypothetical protein
MMRITTDILPYAKAVNRRYIIDE